MAQRALAEEATKHRELLVQRSDSEAAKRPRQPLRKLLAAEAEGWGFG